VSCETSGWPTIFGAVRLVPYISTKLSAKSQVEIAHKTLRQRISLE
jgi:hypothetical protein